MNHKSTFFSLFLAALAAATILGLLSPQAWSQVKTLTVRVDGLV